MISFMRALSVDIFAFFITETEGPTQVTNTNFALLLISSPVYNRMIDAINQNHQRLTENLQLFGYWFNFLYILTLILI